MKQEYLHILINDMFLDMIRISSEEARPGKNTYWVLAERTGSCSISEHNTVYLKSSKIFTQEIIEKIWKFKYLFFHGLSFEAAYLCINSHPDSVLLWRLFGFEAYNSFTLVGNLFDRKTAVLVDDKIRDFLRPIYCVPKNILEKFKYGDTRKNIVRKAMSKVDFLAPVVPEEYDLLKKKLNIKAESVSFPYLSIENFSDNLYNCRVCEANILLGNSASSTNNHIDILELLRNRDLGSRKIYLPLSYGNEKYRRLVIRWLNKYPNDVVPLLDVLPRDKYVEILRLTGIVIMAHNRQQAVGNIVLALWLGAKVYLKKTPVYDYFKRIGLKIYRIDKDLVPENTLALEVLTDKEIEKNREIMYKYFSKSAVSEKIRETFRIVNRCGEKK